MKNDRAGDWLWEEWDGEEIESDSDLIYYTTDWVDLNNDIVRRALASYLQRDGVAESLSDGFKMAESAKVTYTYAGYLLDEKILSTCDDTGETSFGETVSNVALVTLVEV